MPTVTYDSDDLRDSARHGHEAAVHAQLAARSLAGSPVPAPLVFGDVGSATALHGAVAAAYRHHQRRTRDIDDALRDSAQRARHGASIVDENTGATTWLALTGTR